MPNPTALVWFRNDLRLDDNPALTAGAGSGLALIPVFIWDPAGEGDWPPGGASRWWLHQSLGALDRELRGAGSRLILRAGQSGREILKLAGETGTKIVFLNRRYEPALVERDRQVEVSLGKKGIRVETRKASLLYEPWELETGEGNPYKVFTAFWTKARSGLSEVSSLGPPSRIPCPRSWPATLTLRDFSLEPKPDWAAGIRKTWIPGEKQGRCLLRNFAGKKLKNYFEGRDRPDQDGTSRLSAYLHFGEVSPRRVWQIAVKRPEAQPYLRQIVWREFAGHLLYHFPHTPRQALRPVYDGFPWRDDAKSLRAWQMGKTGYPVVDAGMRQLWRTGWMHNRVRMIAASFLVKDLLLPWQMGAEWFWDTLVDADLANNTLGWQWVAGCGADAAPYFRIFNPLLQGEKFDPLGDYVRCWVPELARLPVRWIHRPWQAPADVLSLAGVKLGENYPCRIVDHEFARKRALVAYAKIRGKNRETHGTFS